MTTIAISTAVGAFLGYACGHWFGYYHGRWDAMGEEIERLNREYDRLKGRREG